MKMMENKNALVFCFVGSQTSIHGWKLSISKFTNKPTQIAASNTKTIFFLDKDLLVEVFENYSEIITIEDACITGGVGSAILEFMADNGFQASVNRLGIPDEFIVHGPQEILHQDCNYDAKAIRKIIEQIKNKTKQAI